MNKIAIFGAAGAIGRSVAAALSAQGKPYRVVGRSADALQKSFGADPLAEIVTWNPDDPESVRQSATGVETLIYLVGVNYWEFELHPQLMQKTLSGAIEAGVQKILLIGTVYPYGVPQSNSVREDHPQQPHTFKGKMRKQQEDILMAAHTAGHIKAAVLRLPDFYGPGIEASFLHSPIHAAVHGGTADMVGPIDQPHEFVFVPDVGPVVAALIEAPTAYGRSWNLAGAGATSQKALVEMMEHQTGKALKKRVAGKTLLRLIGVFKPFMREMVEMHYLLTQPVLMDDSALQKLIGPIRKTSYSDGIAKCLAFVSYQK